MTTMTMRRTDAPITDVPQDRLSADESGVKTINLALQGGGAHGAFTWGVLDRLLEDERISFEGITATSAGAINAVVLVYGLIEGGREGARKALANFWRRVSNAAAFSPLQPTLLDRLTHNHSMDMSPAYIGFDMLTRLVSPYQFNPFNYNPLRDVLNEVIDFERLRTDIPLKLFLSATNVRTGKIKVFSNEELSVDAVLASSCMPFLFHAVEIDGEYYWDGGYMGNPAIYPLIYNCDSRDVVVVHVNPIVRNDVPRTARDIQNRINEISFNSSLMREMRAIAFVSRLIDDGQVKNGALRRILIHAIETDDFMCGLGASSKLNADWEFFTHLRDVGREQAGRWLVENFDQLNNETTADIHGKFL